MGSAFAKLRTGKGAQPEPEAVPAPAPAKTATKVAKAKAEPEAPRLPQLPTNLPPALAKHFAMAERVKTLAVIEENPDPSISTFYPLFMLQGGDGGGVFRTVRNEDKRAESKAVKAVCSDDLVEGFIVAFRHCVVAWPEGSGDDTAAKSEPAWRLAYSLTGDEDDEAFHAKVRAACRGYNYTKVVDRGERYDFDTTNIGHLRPSLELLMYIPGLELPEREGLPGDLLVVRSEPTYGSWIASSTSVASVVTAAAKRGIMFPPVSISVDQEQNKTKVRTYTMYSLHAELRVPGEGEQEAFQAFMQEVFADGDESARLSEWADGEGRTDDTVLRSLEMAAELD